MSISIIATIYCEDCHESEEQAGISFEVEPTMDDVIKLLHEISWTAAKAKMQKYYTIDQKWILLCPDCWNKRYAKDTAKECDHEWVEQHVLGLNAKKHQRQCIKCGKFEEL